MEINITITIPPEEFVQILGDSTEVMTKIQTRVVEEMTQKIVQAQTEHFKNMMSNPLNPMNRY